jgi:hypothetical protein
MSNNNIISPIINKNNLKIFSGVVNNNKKNTPSQNLNSSGKTKLYGQTIYEKPKNSPKKNTETSKKQQNSNSTSFVAVNKPADTASSLPAAKNATSSSPVAKNATSSLPAAKNVVISNNPQLTTNSNKSTTQNSNKSTTQNSNKSTTQNSNKSTTQNSNKSTTNKEGITLPSINEIKEKIKETILTKKILYIILYIVILSIIFITLYLIGKYLIKKYVSSNFEILLLDGVKRGDQAYVITQDPLSKSYIPIKRSDGQQGIQFSYSLWMYIDKISNDKQHIFHKGNVEEYPLMCPAVYLHKNNLSIHINTLEEIDESIIIKEIPVRKWIYLSLVINNKNMDIYINGYLKDRKILSSLPKQNNSNFWCNMNGGFNGFISNIIYYPYTVELSEIINKVEDGPPNSSCISTSDKPPYLSRSWFSSF